MMKLNKAILEIARLEVDRHLLADLQFAQQLHAFLRDEISLQQYLHNESGFKRFLYDYRVGRTLQAGDKAKVNMLNLVKSFSFTDSHVADIALLAALFQKKKLSTISVNGKYGYPQSFASKLMSVHRPDVVIPYDSYAVKSIESIHGAKVKSLDQYYAGIEKLRSLHFRENGKAIGLVKLSDSLEINRLCKKLRVDVDRLLSLKLTDKYLWCMEWIARKNKVT